MLKFKVRHAAHPQSAGVAGERFGCHRDRQSILWRFPTVISVRQTRLNRATLHCAAALVLTLVAAALAGPARAQPAAEKPRYVREIERQVREGDWVLQCDSWIACRILGVVKPGTDAAESRPVVMIDRGWKKDAAYRVQIAFIDGYGQILHANPDATWRVGKRGKDQIAFRFDPAEPVDGPANAVPPDSATDIVDRLRGPGNVALDDGAGRRLRLPRGDLAGLLTRMDRLQRPAIDPLTPAERTEWLKQYRYVVRRGQPIEGVEVPKAVALSCDTRASARYVDGWRLDAGHVFWIAHCQEGSRMFLHKTSEQPIAFDMRNFGGGVQRDVYARFDPETSLLTVKLSQDGRGDCGHRVRFGWTGAQGFGMVEHRRMTVCRNVPAEFWPLNWTPTSWRYADGQSASSGDTPPGADDVRVPSSPE